MYLIGRGAAGEPRIESIKGLDHPHGIPGQVWPTHRFGATAVVVVISCLTVARSLSAILAGPLSTSNAPSGPICTATLLPSTMSIYTLPCTGITCTSPSCGLSAITVLRTSIADLDRFIGLYEAAVAGFNVKRKSG